MNHSTLTAFAGVAAAIGGAILKGCWDWLRGRTNANATVRRAEIVDAGQFRAELWTEIEKLRTRIDEIQGELDKTRRGYLELLAEHTALKAEHTALQLEHDMLLLKHAGLEREFAALREGS